MRKFLSVVVFAAVFCIGCNSGTPTQPTEYIYGADTCKTTGISCDIEVKWCKHDNYLDLSIQPFTGFQQAQDTFKIYLPLHLQPVIDEYFIGYHGNSIFNDNEWIEKPSFKICSDGMMIVTGKFNYNNGILTGTHRPLCFAYNVITW